MYYTTYRPQTFSEMLKPNNVAVALANQLKHGKTAHAYLFVGPRGTGKTTTARILAKALNCENLLENGDPCNECAHCISIANGAYLDLIEIDAASNRGIDDIRELKEKIKLAPSVGKNKVYIIDEVHMLTTEAFNALLKTLEEPPANVTFALCTTEMHKVPETIQSRCQVFKIRRATVLQITKKLEEIAQKEGADISNQDLKLIANAAQGGFRDAETLLQQVIEGELEVSSLLNLDSEVAYADFLDLLLEHNASMALHKISKIYADGLDLYVWTGEFLRFMRDILFVKMNAYEGLVDVSDDLLERMQKQAASLDNIFLTQIMEVFLEAQNQIKESFIVQLPLELAVVKLFEPKQAPVSQKNLQMPPRPAPTTSNITQVKTIESSIIKEEFETIIETKEELIEEVSVVSTENTQNNTLEISFVHEKWTTVISQISSINNSISALLKSAKVSETQGCYIVLEVPFDFHKERLEAINNRQIVEDVLGRILEQKVLIKCAVKKQPKKKLKTNETGKLTDHNLLVPMGVGLNEPITDNNVLDVFDGGLPI